MGRSDPGGADESACPAGSAVTHLRPVHRGQEPSRLLGVRAADRGGSVAAVDAATDQSLRERSCGEGPQPVHAIARCLVHPQGRQGWLEEHAPGHHRRPVHSRAISGAAAPTSGTPASHPEIALLQATDANAAGHCRCAETHPATGAGARQLPGGSEHGLGPEGCLSRRWLRYGCGSGTPRSPQP